MFDEASDTAANVRMASRLSRWLRTAGVEETELAVDFADLVSAARQIDAILERLLTLDMSDQVQADSALDEVGHLNALLFSEIKDHLGDLERGWSAFEQRLRAWTPDDGESDSDDDE